MTAPIVLPSSFGATLQLDATSRGALAQIVSAGGRQTASLHQEQLKELGDWIAGELGLELVDPSGQKPAPDGEAEASEPTIVTFGEDETRRLGAIDVLVNQVFRDRGLVGLTDLAQLADYVITGVVPEPSVTNLRIDQEEL